MIQKSEKGGRGTGQRRIHLEAGGLLKHNLRVYIGVLWEGHAREGVWMEGDGYM